jgi:hypothetical protein
VASRADAGFLSQLPELLHRWAGGQHGAGADLEHLHKVRRLPGTPGCDGGRQRLWITALKGGLHPCLVLLRIECCE